MGEDYLNELKFALDYASDSYGENSPYLLPIITKLADLFKNKNKINAALKLFTYAVVIVEKN